MENIRTSRDVLSARSAKAGTPGMDTMLHEAQRLSSLASQGALTTGVVLSTLKRIQTDAYTKGARHAASPILQMSDDIDRRLAALNEGADGRGR